MIIVDAHEVATNLGSFLEKVEHGETVVIAVHDRPVAEMRAPTATSTGLRPYGLCKGEFTVPDDFDSPLPSDVLADFDGR